MAKTKTQRLAVAASAAALLMTGCASSNDNNSAKKNTTSKQIQDKDSDMGRCNGANACKGSGACATSNNACAKQNSCRGKGWLPLPKSECEASGGRFMGFKKRPRPTDKKC